MYPQFDSCLNDFCCSEKFKTSVRNTVRDEMFWRDLMQNNNINIMVKDELNKQIPNQVKSEASLIVDRMVDDKLNNYVTYNLPSQVVKVMSDQMPYYLNNSVQMQNILAQHSQNLNQQLYNSATETLNNLTNEEQYHHVTNSHLNAMTKRFDNNLNTLNYNAEKQLNDQKTNFNNSLKTMQDQVNNEISFVKECNNKFDSLESKVIKLQEQNNMLKWSFVGLLIICCLPHLLLYLYK